MANSDKTSSKSKSMSIYPEQNKKLTEDLKVRVKELEKEITSLKSELKEKNNTIEELKSRLEMQTAQELRAETQPQPRPYPKRITDLKKAKAIIQRINPDN